MVGPGVGGPHYRDLGGVKRNVGGPAFVGGPVVDQPLKGKKVRGWSTQKTLLAYSFFYPFILVDQPGPLEKSQNPMEVQNITMGGLVVYYFVLSSQSWRFLPVQPVQWSKPMFIGVCCGPYSDDLPVHTSFRTGPPRHFR